MSVRLWVIAVIGLTAVIWALAACGGSDENADDVAAPQTAELDANGSADSEEDVDSVSDDSENGDVGSVSDDGSGDSDSNGDDPQAPCPPDDKDCDGFTNVDDNCPDTANGDQADGDQDDVGDACDPCPNNPTRTQLPCSGNSTPPCSGVSFGGEAGPIMVPAQVQVDGQQMAATELAVTTVSGQSGLALACLPGSSGGGGPQFFCDDFDFDGLEAFVLDAPGNDRYFALSTVPDTVTINAVDCDDADSAPGALADPDGLTQPVNIDNLIRQARSVLPDLAVRPPSDSSDSSPRFDLVDPQVDLNGPQLNLADPQLDLADPEFDRLDEADGLLERLEVPE